LEDARRDISTEIIAEMRNRYLKAFSDMDIKAFDDSWAVLGAMRHCKVIGIFTRLCVRDKKPVYLEHIPRLWRLLDVSFENPVLSEIKEWIDCYIPENARKIPNV
ncbi:MAG: aminoglycoside phosphotransferase, partial [Alphaproteobacteria bacterium]|nr:aminoglycoside phosphotransferase [Alphaproteobacteria bacterium]